MTFPRPADESARLDSLRSLFILDTPAEDRFDRLTRLARKVFDTPFSMLTLIDDERQWFKSAQGHSVTESPRSLSFCQYTILDEGAMVVEDVSKDPRFSDLPVVRDMGVQFYAGVPVHGPDYRRIGTFCILDRRAREMSDEDVNTLEDLARCAESELHLMRKQKLEADLMSEMDGLRRKASVDAVTRCWNETVIRELFAKIRASRGGDASGGPAVLMIELGRLAQVNEELGSESGDQVLREAADRLRAVAPSGAMLGRLRGSRFLLCFENLAAKNADEICAKIMDRLAGHALRTHGGVARLEGHAGLAFHSTSTESDEALLDRAEKAMMRAKREQPGSFRRSL